MDSVWLKKQEEENKKLQKNSAGEKKKGLLIAVVILVVMFGGGYMATMSQNSSAASDSQSQMATIFVLGAMLLVIVMFVLLSKKSTTRDSAKKLKEHLNDLLTTKEQVQQFDSEMMSEPLDKVECGGPQGDTIQFTEHFLHSAFLDYTNLPDHRFVRYSDIAEMRFAITKDETKALGLGKLFMIDLLNASGEKIMGLSIHGRERIDEFEGLLEKYCPDVKMQKHSFLGLK